MNNKNRSRVFIGVGITLIFATGLIVFVRQNNTAAEKTSYPVEQASPATSINLPSEYPSQDAIDDGCYVNLHGDIYGENVMTEWIEQVTQKQSATIRTVAYTVEGDPIITDVSYHSNCFSVTQDATRDRYGSKSVINRKLNNLVSYYDAALKRTYFYITDLSEISDEQFEKGVNGVILKIEQ